jgi:tetratricopeptide (TPR) repeat protein
LVVHSQQVLKILGCAVVCLSASSALAQPWRHIEAQAAVRRGEYEKAVDLARPFARNDASAAAIAAGALELNGHAEEAYALLSRALERWPEAIRLRAQLAALENSFGDKAAAESNWRRVLGSKDVATGPYDYIALGAAARALDQWPEAEGFFREAVNRAPGLKRSDALVALADFLLTAGRQDEAANKLGVALKIDSSSANAHELKARILIALGASSRLVQSELDTVLRINPVHRAALLLQTDIAIRSGDLDRAQRNCRTLTIVLLDSKARSLCTALAVFRRQARPSDEDIPPTLKPEFYQEVAENLGGKGLLQEAVEFDVKVIEASPNYPRGHAMLGFHLLNLGRQAEASSALHRALDLGYREQWLVSLLQFLETSLPQKYMTLAGERCQLTIRNRPYDREIAKRHFLPFVSAIWRQLREEFGLPDLTVHVQFLDNNDFSVRLAGAPFDSAAGISIGNFVVLRSADGNAYHWTNALVHEMVHRIFGELSGHRAPRWFQEGVAEEEADRRAGSFDSHFSTLDTAYALRGDSSWSSIDRLSAEFSRLGDPWRGRFVYALSRQVIRSISKRWGTASLAAAARLFSSGDTTRGVLVGITRLDAARFDKWLRDELRKGVESTRDQFHVPEYIQSDALISYALEGVPTDPVFRGLVAHSLGRAGRIDDAERLLDRPTSRQEVFARAELAALKDYNATSIALLHRLIADGGDGYDARLLLGELEAKRGNDSEAAFHLRIAASWAPDEPQSLIDLARRSTVSELERLRLLKNALRSGASTNALSRLHAMPEVVHDSELKWIAESGLAIAPYSPLVHDVLQAVLRADGDTAGAAAAAQLAWMLRHRSD